MNLKNAILYNQELTFILMCQCLFEIKAKLRSFTSKGGRSQLYTELLKTGSDLYIGGLTGRRYPSFI